MLDTFRAFVLAGCTAVAASVSGAAVALPVSPGAWVPFSFGAVGSSWDRTFDFIVSGQAQLKVTDGFLSGDRFSVSDHGTFLFDTTDPTTSGDQIGDDWDAAFAGAEWSSGTFLFGPGTYRIGGTATESPFGSGGGAVRVDALSGTVAPVPLPGPALLLLSGLGAIYVARRRKTDARSAAV